MPNFNPRSEKERIRHNEWQDPDGHPCPKYVAAADQEEGDEKNRYYAALDKLILSPPNSSDQTTSRRYPETTYSSDYHHSERQHSIGIGTCAYRHCTQKSELYRCQYCTESFCDEHKTPKRPLMPNFNARSDSDRADLDEWNKPGGHPCPNYAIALQKQREQEKERYDDSLDRLLRQKYSARPSIPNSSSQEWRQTSYSYPSYTRNYDNDSDLSFSKIYRSVKRSIKNLVNFLVPLLVVGGIIYVFYFLASGNLLFSHPLVGCWANGVSFGSLQASVGIAISGDHTFSMTSFAGNIAGRWDEINNSAIRIHYYDPMHQTTAENVLLYDASTNTLVLSEVPTFPLIRTKCG